MQCFLDKDRACSEDCMAYTGASEECRIVMAAQQFGLAMAAILGRLAPRDKTVHPKSAPPPEVKL